MPKLFNVRDKNVPESAVFIGRPSKCGLKKTVSTQLQPTREYFYQHLFCLRRLGESSRVKISPATAIQSFVTETCLCKYQTQVTRKRL